VRAAAVAATTVLGLVLVAAIAGTAVATPDTSVEPSAASAAAVEQPLAGHQTALATQRGATYADSLPETLEGEVTTPPQFVGDRVLVGTERGLYVVSDGAIEAFAPTGPVEAVEHLEGDRAVVLVDDTHAPNVLGVDLGTGEVRWTDARARLVYSPDLGEVDRQVPAFDATAVGDVDGDGTTDVAVAAGSAVLAIDGGSGDRLWTTEYRRNVWRVASVDGRVVAGTQAGTLLALDADDGGKVYERAVAEPFESQDVGVGTVPRSVWSVEPFTVAGVDRLAVTTEDGTVAVVDPEDGTMGWRQKVFEFDADDLTRYYRSGLGLVDPATVPGDANFFNVRATPLEDEGALAVEVHIDGRPTLRRYGDGTSQLHLLDVDSGAIRWSNEDAGLATAGPLAYAPEIGDGSLVAASAPEQATQSLRFIDVDDGTGRTQSLAVPPDANRFGQQTGTGYAAVDGDRLAVTASDSDLLVGDPDGELEWSVPAVRDVETRRGDYTGDGTDDVLLTSQSAMEGGIRSRSLLVRSGTDGALAWADHLSVEAFFEQGGYQKVRNVETDDGRDIVAIRTPPRRPGTDPQEMPPSLVVVRDRETGERLARHELVNDEGQYSQSFDGQKFRPLSFDVLGDLTGNGNPDAVVGLRGRVVVLDLRTGEVVWERLYREAAPESDGEQWAPVDGEAIFYRSVGETDDGRTRLAAFSRNRGEIAVVEPETGPDGFEGFRTVEETTYDGELVARFDQRRLGDLTGGGSDELLVPIHDDDTASKVFSPESGEMLAAFGRPDQISVASSDVAVTGDGRPATVVFERAGEDSRTLVYAGGDEVFTRTGETAYRLGDVEPGAPTPAAPAGDVDGDGTEEVGYVESSDQAGVRIRFHDGETGQSVDTFELTRWEESDDAPVPAVQVSRIPDRTGDEQPELGVVAMAAGGDEAGPRFFVVDPAEREVLVSGEGAVSEFVALEGAVGIVGDDGSVRAVDVTQGVSIAEPDSASTMELEWEFDAVGDYVTTVTVGDRPVAQTTDRSQTLRLPAGTHEIAVRATRSDGLTVHDSVTVTVEEGSWMDLLLYGASALSVFLLFAFGLVPALVGRIRR
jgi:outer membrane protein assembly factor BamB